jgi:hypothetical protein
LTADEWFSGRDASPKLIRVETLYQSTAIVRHSKSREFVPLTAKGIPPTEPSPSASTRHSEGNMQPPVSSKPSQVSNISDPSKTVSMSPTKPQAKLVANDSTVNLESRQIC